MTKKPKLSERFPAPDLSDEPRPGEVLATELADIPVRIPRSAAEVLELCPERLEVEDANRHLADFVTLEAGGVPAEWVTGTGRVSAIAELADSHLFNAVRFLIRKAAIRRARQVGESIGWMGSETWGPRGEGATMACEAEADAMANLTWVDYACPKLWALLAEARARELPEMDVRSIERYGLAADQEVLPLELAAMKRVSDADKLIQVRKAIG